MGGGRATARMWLLSRISLLGPAWITKIYREFAMVMKRAV